VIAVIDDIADTGWALFFADAIDAGHYFPLIEAWTAWALYSSEGIVAARKIRASTKVESKWSQNG
jgi:hypothetical protein